MAMRHEGEASMRILLTRPANVAEETAQTLQAAGHEVLLEPLLTVEALDVVLPNAKIYDGIILTSINAATALDLHWNTARHIPIFTTGIATEKAALKIGFTNTHSVEGSVVQLVDQLPEAMAGSNLLYPCAETTAHNVEKLLADRDINCTPWPVYRTVETSCFSNSARKALAAGTVDAVLLYSARTAACCARLIENEKLLAPTAYCLSEQVAAALPDALRSNCKFPDQPTEKNLLALLRNNHA